MRLCVAAILLVLLGACSRDAQSPSEPASARPVAISQEILEQGPELPIESGTYIFRHQFAEHPSMESIELKVIVNGRRVRVVNEQGGDVFEKGVLDEGFLVWHPRTGQWIIAKRDSDMDEFDVGGCSGGPAVIDLTGKVYWTC